jgi:hypothetical protein
MTGIVDKKKSGFDPCDSIGTRGRKINLPNWCICAAVRYIVEFARVGSRVDIIHNFFVKSLGFILFRGIYYRSILFICQNIIKEMCLDFFQKDWKNPSRLEKGGGLFVDDDVSSSSMVLKPL